MVKIPRLDQIEAAEGLLGLGERPIGDHVTADRGSGAGWLERVAADNRAALLADLLGEPPVCLRRRLPGIRAAIGVALLSLVDQDRVLSHGDLLLLSSIFERPRTPTTNGTAQVRHPGPCVLPPCPPPQRRRRTAARSPRLPGPAHRRLLSRPRRHRRQPQRSGRWSPRSLPRRPAARSRPRAARSADVRGG